MYKPFIVLSVSLLDVNLNGSFVQSKETQEGFIENIPNLISPHLS